MVNKDVKNYYFTQIPIKVLLLGTIISISSTFFTWIRLEGLLAVFAGTEMTKFIKGVKSITIIAHCLSLFWLLIGLILTHKTLRWISLSSALLMTFFLYMAYRSFFEQESNTQNKMYQIILFVGFSLLYIMPIIMALKNNFKCLFVNIILILFFLSLVLGYIVAKFSAKAMATLGILLQFAPYVALAATLITLIGSTLIAIKVRRDLHNSSSDAQISLKTEYPQL
ncbi:MAG: hypothetical protein NZ455_07980 [Bacteroidia bacterium]|nr:hypothetical protein [Bacteroidia bacterium]MDW8345936.1 hypothetical protein [Bacteroidia bacterium]